MLSEKWDVSSHSGHGLEKKSLKKIGNPNVTVIIPALNEEKSISKVLWELNHFGYNKILIVDGNSRDRTVKIAKEFGANIISQNGKGKGDALRQAFNHGSLDTDVVVILDADGSMNIKEIPVFIDAIHSGADLAKGSRFLKHGYSEDMTMIRKFGNKFFLFLVNLFWSANYTDLCYGLAVFRNDAVRKLYPHLKSQNFEIETEIFIKAKKIGLNVIEIPSIEFKRSHGKSKLVTFLDGFRILQTIIDEFFDQFSKK